MEKKKSPVKNAIKICAASYACANENLSETNKEINNFWESAIITIVIGIVTHQTNLVASNK